MPGALLLLGILSGSTAASELPEGKGRGIVEDACLQCHDLKTTTDARHGLGEWREVIYVMISEGADLLEEEVEIVARYLAKHFGPEDRPGPAPGTRGEAVPDTGAPPIPR